MPDCGWEDINSCAHVVSECVDARRAHTDTDTPQADPEPPSDPSIYIVHARVCMFLELLYACIARQSRLRPNPSIAIASSDEAVRAFEKKNFSSITGV